MVTNLTCFFIIVGWLAIHLEMLIDGGLIQMAFKALNCLQRLRTITRLSI